MDSGDDDFQLYDPEEPDRVGQARRLEQLSYLVREQQLTEEEARKLGTLDIWSRSYKFHTLYDTDEFVALHKPFDVRIDVPWQGRSAGRKWPTEVTVADWFLAKEKKKYGHLYQHIHQSGQGPATHDTATAIHAIHAPNTTARKDGLRLRFVNQLDYATSGIMLMAKSKAAARRASRLFETREVHKEYAALVYGWPTWNKDNSTSATTTTTTTTSTSTSTSSMHIHARLVDVEGHQFRRQCVVPTTIPRGTRCGENDETILRGQEAHTEVWLETSGWLEFPGFMPRVKASLVRVKLHTGRRHQIRLHLAHVGHPIVGDITYAVDEAEAGKDLKEKNHEYQEANEARRRLVAASPRMFLHAEKLSLCLGTNKGEAPVEIACPSEFGSLLSPW